MKLGFISDIHEDIEQLKQALRILGLRKCDKLICLGDIVGYSVRSHNDPYALDFLWSRNAPEVINLIKRKCEIVVVGNHDLFAIKKLPQHRAGFQYPENWYARDYWKRHTLFKDKVWIYEENELSARLTKNDEKFIAELPEFVVGNFDGVNILLSHYAYPDLVGNTKFEPKTPMEAKEHFQFMQKLGCNLGISGHDHKEGIMRFTPREVKEFPFGRVAIDRNTPTWFHGPSIARGNRANGVMVFNTETFEAEIIPLVK